MSKYKVIESYNDQKVGDIIELTAEDAESLVADGRIEAVVEEEAPVNVSAPENAPAETNTASTPTDESKTE